MLTTMHYRFGHFEVRRDTRRLLADGTDIAIGGRAFDLLLSLIERRDRVVSVDELYTLVWPGRVVEPNNLPVQIWSLRRALGREVIATVPRRGYQFMPDVEVHVLTADGAAAAPAEALRGEPVAETFERLRVKLRRHALVTLIDPRGVAGRREAGALRFAADFTDGVWRVDVAASAGTGCDALIQRLAGRDALLWLDDCDRSPQHARAIVRSARRHAPGLSIVAAAERPLGEPDEAVVRITDLVAGGLVAGAPVPDTLVATPATSSAASGDDSPLRWRSRRPAAGDAIPRASRH